MTPAEVTALLAERGTWTYSRASGPGGQRRDHAETRAELTLRAADLDALPRRIAARVEAGLGLSHRSLRLTSQDQRSRERNRAVVVARLEQRVARALAPPSPTRRPTRPSRGAKERRLAAKARRAGLKEGRRRPEPEG